MTTATKTHTHTNNAFIAALRAELGAKSTDVATQGGSGTSPKTGFDCSGLIYYILTKLGYKNVPRDSAGQWAWVLGRVSTPSGSITPAQMRHLKPGMLVFSNWPGDTENPGHVQIYIGKGQLIQSPGTANGKVEITTLAADAGHIVGFGRIPNMTEAAMYIPTGYKGPHLTTHMNYWRSWHGGDPTKPLTKTDNAIALLTFLGIMPTQGNIQALVAQQQGEGIDVARNHHNPFATTLALPGSTPIAGNSSGVQSYKNWQDGIYAAAMTYRQANMRPALLALISGNNNTPPTCSAFANALEHSQYAGTSSAPNVAYGKYIGGLCSTPVQPATGSWLKIMAGIAGGVYESAPTKQIGEVGNAATSAISGVTGFYHSIEHFIGLLTSAKTWWIVLGGLLILIGIFMLFRHQIGSAVQTGKSATVVAA